MFGGEEWEFRGPVLVGDTVTAQRRLGAVEEKDGRSGPFVLLHYETTFTNQRDEVVAVSRLVGHRPMSEQRLARRRRRRRRARAGRSTTRHGRSCSCTARRRTTPTASTTTATTPPPRAIPTSSCTARSRAAWLSQYVTDWAGPRGRMLTLTWQNRRSALPEHDYVFRGVVRGVDDDVVELEVWAEDGDGAC